MISLMRQPSSSSMRTANFDAAKTNEVLRARLAESKEAVVPGFYGAMPESER